MKIHEIIHHPALQVIPDITNDHAVAHVHDLAVRELLLAVDRLVHLLVVADAIAEVLRRQLRVLARVVRRGGLDLTDVGHDELLVVALGLDEQRVDVGPIADLLDPAPPLARRVGRVEQRHRALAAPEPGQHVRDGGLGGHLAQPLALGIALGEEVGRRLRRVLPPVRADVEILGRDREPSQVAGDFLRNEALPLVSISGIETRYDGRNLGTRSCGKADHDHA